METAADIESKARAGDTAAMLALGRRYMADPATGDAGLKLIVDAAHGGSGEAAHLVSLMSGFDHTEPNRWDYALAYLGRAAKAGHAPSQKTLAFLAGDLEAELAIAGGERLADAEWHRLHGAIDAASWLKIPAARVLRESPCIAAAENFITPAMCDWIVERARPHLARAQVYNPGGGGRTALTRTNSEMRFDFEQLDLVLLFTAARTAALTGFVLQAMEPASVLHYAPGQEFRRHHDYLDPDVPAYAVEVAKIGQRVATLLVYLNDDYTGGETDFPDAKLRFKGRKGDALLFHNVTPSGAPDPRTLHAGLPPASGEKWLYSQWIRTKPAAARG